MDILNAMNLITSDYANLRGKVTNSDILRMLGLLLGINDANIITQFSLLNQFFIKGDEIRQLNGEEKDLKRVEQINIYLEIIPELKEVLKIHYSENEIKEVLGVA